MLLYPWGVPAVRKNETDVEIYLQNRTIPTSGILDALHTTFVLMPLTPPAAASIFWEQCRAFLVVVSIIVVVIVVNLATVVVEAALQFSLRVEKGCCLLYHSRARHWVLEGSAGCYSYARIDTLFRLVCMLSGQRTVVERHGVSLFF